MVTLQFSMLITGMSYLIGLSFHNSGGSYEILCSKASWDIVVVICTSSSADLFVFSIVSFDSEVTEIDFVIIFPVSLL